MYHVILKDEKGDMVDTVEVSTILDATMMVLTMATRLRVGGSVVLKSMGNI